MTAAKSPVTDEEKVAVLQKAMRDILVLIDCGLPRPNHRAISARASEALEATGSPRVR